jgi:hypothetical protein
MPDVYYMMDENGWPIVRAHDSYWMHWTWWSYVVLP